MLLDGRHVVHLTVAVPPVNRSMFVLEGHLIFDTPNFILPTESDERRALTDCHRSPSPSVVPSTLGALLLLCSVVLETDRNRRITMKFTASALALAAPLMANGAFHFWEGFIELVEKSRT